MVKKTNIEHIVDTIVGEIEFFKVEESLNTLHFFKLTSSQMQNSHKFEGSAKISEAFYNRIVHL